MRLFSCSTGWTAHRDLRDTSATEHTRPQIVYLPTRVRSRPFLSPDIGLDATTTGCFRSGIQLQTPTKTLAHHCPFCMSIPPLSHPKNNFVIPNSGCVNILSKVRQVARSLMPTRPTDRVHPRTDGRTNALAHVRQVILPSVFGRPSVFGPRA